MGSNVVEHDHQGSTNPSTAYHSLRL